MKKRITALILACAAITAALTGCSGEQKYQGDSEEVLLVEDGRNFNIYVTTVDGQKFLIVDSDYSTGGIAVTPIAAPTN